MRLLLVEDDRLLAEGLVRQLGKAGFSVDTSPSAREAVVLGEQEDYRAVVLDLGLPDGNGLDVLRKWRTNHVSCPVLILTARGDWQDKVNGLKAGADDYLAKPFQTEELIARLNALVRRSEGRSMLRLKPAALNWTKTARVSRWTTAWNIHLPAPNSGCYVV